MKWISTKNRRVFASFQEAIESGMAEDGGLFLPEAFPKVALKEIEAFRSLPFPEIAAILAEKWLVPGIDAETVEAKTRSALNFPLPLCELSPSLSVLELFHGPSFSFKDFGARFLARFLGGPKGKPRIVLTATSGDTGSAVAHAFFGLDGVRVVLLYPSGAVSPLQEMQMTTLGKNISPLEIEGSFDDCQSLAKQAFQDPDLKDLQLTSANSINIGRLLPQSFYYFYALSRILKTGERQKVACVVPSGNLGNLTGGVFAKRTGCPVDFFVAGANQNDPLGPWLRSGVTSPRRTVKTLSNAMDVGNPSNLERLSCLYEDKHLEMKKEIATCPVSDEETLQAMKEIHQRYGYLIDPHTAVGWKAWQKLDLKGYARVLFLATAHPAKFSTTVLKATGVEPSIPEELRKAMEGKKKSLRLSENYPEFAAWLRQGL